MYSLDEIIRQNNPKPGDYKKQIAENEKRNSRVEIVKGDDPNFQEKLQNTFEGK